MKYINYFMQIFGWVVAWIIADLFGLFKAISERMDNIFYYAYSFEKFGNMAVAWRWIMLLSTVYVITMLITRAVNKIIDDINA